MTKPNKQKNQETFGLNVQENEIFSHGCLKGWLQHYHYFKIPLLCVCKGLFNEMDQSITGFAGWKLKVRRTLNKIRSLVET